MAKKIYYAFGYEPSPSYVTDGLVLYLDADGGASYPGTGATWADLSGNGYDATLIGSPAYNAGSGGYIEFVGPGDAVALNNGWSGENASNQYTIEFVVSDIVLSLYTLDTNSNRTIVGLRNQQAGGANIGFYTNGSWHSFGVYPSDGSVNRVTIIVDGTSQSAFLNGAASGSPASKTFVNLFAATGPTLMNRFTYGAGEDGRIHQFMVYNKALSSAEVSQNTSAFQSRFGY